MKEIYNYVGFRKGIKQTLIIICGILIYHGCEQSGTWWSLLLFFVAAVIARLIVEIRTEPEEEK